MHHFHALGDLSGSGRFTDLAWRDTAGIRGDILALPFVVGPADGSLPADHFSYCLQQDALYLREYAGVLARTAALAPFEAEQRFWLAAADSFLGNEADPHPDRLLRETGTRFGDGDAGPAGAHPYGAWITTCTDPDVAEATARAKQIADETHRRASPAERRATLAAFRWSALHELHFFDAARVHGPGRAPRGAADLREEAVLP